MDCFYNSWLCFMLDFWYSYWKKFVIRSDMMFDKYKQKCPDCGKRLKYWKPISDKDIESWYCSRCPNLFKEKGKKLCHKE